MQTETRRALHHQIKRLCDTVWWICNIEEVDDNALLITGDGLSILRFKVVEDQGQIELASKRHFPSLHKGESYSLDAITAAVTEMAKAESVEAFESRLLVAGALRTSS